MNSPDGICALMMLTLPFALVLSMEEERTPLKVIGMFSSAVIFASLLMTWYAGGFLAASIGVTWLCFILFRNMRITLIVAFCLTMALGFVVFRTNTPVFTVTRSHFITELSLNEHATRWRDELENVKPHWLLGSGIGMTGNTPRSGETAAVYIEENPIQTNLLLHWLKEMGMAGAILLTLFVITIYRIVSTQIIRQRNSPYAEALGAVWIVFLTAGIFDALIGTQDRNIPNVMAGCMLGTTALLPTLDYIPPLAREQDGHGSNEEPS